MFTVQLVVNVFAVGTSVIVIVSVVPTYVMWTFITWPLWRSIAPRLVAGVVGEAPFVYRPVEFVPSPALL